MRNPTTGISFISKTPSLPNTTFVSVDAVMWLMGHVEGVTREKRAIGMIEQMLEQNYIRHASGDNRVKFRFVFYLYYLLEKVGGVGVPAYQCDIVAFRALRLPWNYTVLT